jgi:hypothetical protein
MTAVLFFDQRWISAEIISKRLTMYIGHARLVGYHTMESLFQLHPLITLKCLLNLNTNILADAVSHSLA